MHICFSFLILFATLFSFHSYAQDIVATDRTLYQSQEDDLVTINKISVLPILDNVGGIYARPLEQHLIQQVDKNHRWDYAQLNLVGPLVTPEELESSPNKVQSISAGLDTDAILSARLTKGPNGISIKLSMFLTKDNLLFAQETAKNFKRFEIRDLKDKVDELFKNLTKKIPYQGMILSRQNNRITINLGKNDGMEEGRIITIVQIIRLNRHPKFNFIINAEKEVLGKAKLLKIDKTLSFGKIVSEKEKGVIQKFAKVSGLDFVTYTGSDTLTDNSSTQDEVLKRPDGMISFGRNAVSWLPKKPPTFGKFGAIVGNSLYNYKLKQDEAYNSDSVFNPSIAIKLELWMTPNWTLHTGIRQGIIDLENPRADSAPSDLNASMSFFEFLVGYKYRMSPSIWGPQVELLGGMANYDLKVDDSDPRTFTSTKYSGLKFGLSGSTPLDKKNEWGLGADLFFFFRPNVSESPSASGSGDESSINQFGVFGTRKLALNLKARASLNFELFNTNYSGGDATSSSQKITSLDFGLFYMF